ncbi:expressed unknown protein [Seminavis robusta]|uniref:Uncharacterized protein n=1 Tax=Seminavis robusta TaxID=568900 RepID=A0A9N8DYK0_9STRA|nr:expressed unknown protein [Seminavis robusta]|eukprot:Sro467_g148970.1 n/a (278) ;mRNA; r:48482-49559
MGLSNLANKNLQRVPPKPPSPTEPRITLQSSIDKMPEVSAEVKGQIMTTWIELLDKDPSTAAATCCLTRAPTHAEIRGASATASILGAGKFIAVLGTRGPKPDDEDRFGGTDETTTEYYPILPLIGKDICTLVHDGLCYDKPNEETNKWNPFVTAQKLKPYLNDIHSILLGLTTASSTQKVRGAIKFDLKQRATVDPPLHELMVPRINNILHPAVYQPPPDNPLGNTGTPTEHNATVPASGTPTEHNATTPQNPASTPTGHNAPVPPGTPTEHNATL